MSLKLDSIYPAILRCKEDWNAPHWRTVRNFLEQCKPQPVAAQLDFNQYALSAAERIGFEKCIVELEKILNYEKRIGEKNVSTTS